MKYCRNTQESMQGRSHGAPLHGFFWIMRILILGTIIFMASYHAVLALSQATLEKNASYSMMGNIDLLNHAQQAMTAMQFEDASYAAKEYLARNSEGYSRWTAWEILVDAAVACDKIQEAVNLLDDMYYEFAGQVAYVHAISLKKAPLLEVLHRHSEAISLYASIEQAHYKGIPSSSHGSVGILSVEQQGHIQYRMAELFMLEQNFSSAEEKLRSCMGLEELHMHKRVQCAYTLAQVYSLTHKESEAKELLRQLWTIEDVPQHVHAGIGYLLADILERKGKKSEAKAMFEAVRSFYPNVGVVDMRLKLLK